MSITTLSSREFNHDVGRAKKACAKGPVIVTDRGRPSHVLLSYAEYERLSGQDKSLISRLSAPGLSEVDFAPQRLDIAPRQIDLA